MLAFFLERKETKKIGSHFYGSLLPFVNKKETLEGNILKGNLNFEIKWAWAQSTLTAGGVCEKLLSSSVKWVPFT